MNGKFQCTKTAFTLVHTCAFQAQVNRFVGSILIFSPQTAHKFANSADCVVGHDTWERYGCGAQPIHEVALVDCVFGNWEKRISVEIIHANFAIYSIRTSVRFHKNRWKLRSNHYDGIAFSFASTLGGKLRRAGNSLCPLTILAEPTCHYALEPVMTPMRTKRSCRFNSAYRIERLICSRNDPFHSFY